MKSLERCALAGRLATASQLPLNRMRAVIRQYREGAATANQQPFNGIPPTTQHDHSDPSTASKRPFNGIPSATQQHPRAHEQKKIYHRCA